MFELILAKNKWCQQHSTSYFVLWACNNYTFLLEKTYIITF